MSQLNRTFAQGHFTFMGKWHSRIDQCRSIRVWLSLGTTVNDYFILRIPLKVCWSFHGDSIAAQCLPLLTLTSSPSLLCLLRLRVHSPQQTPYTLHLSQAYSGPNLGRVEETEAWSLLIHTLWKSPGLLGSILSYSLIVHVNLNNV